MQMLKRFSFLLTGILFFLLTGCHNFYKASLGKTGAYAAGSIDSLISKSRFFILRNGTQAYHIKAIAINADRKTLSCKLDTLAIEHKLHLMNGRRGKMQYKKFDPKEYSVLKEVHLFTGSDTTALIGANYSLPLDNILKVEIIEKDKSRSTTSYVIGGVAYTLGAFTILVLVVAATGGFDFNLY